MSFAFDQGPAPRVNLFRIDRAEGLLNGVLDSLPDNATQAQIDSAIVQFITGELRTPKTLKTVRRRLLQLWPLIEPLAEREPEQFDAVILEFAEISTSLS